MGNQNSGSDIKLHGLYRSPEVKLVSRHEGATFPPYSRDSMSYFSRPLSRMTRIQVFHVKFQVIFAAFCTVIIGFRSKQVVGDAVPLASNPDVTFWDLTKGTVTIRGRLEHQVSVPSCRSGAVCQCTIDTGTGVVSCTVHNPGTDSLTKEVLIDRIPYEIWPFIGVLQNGSSPVKIQLIPLNQQAEEECLVDLSVDTVFDLGTACGVLTVSRNGKVVQRSSDQQGNTCVLVNRVMVYGKHHWTLQVHLDFGASICLGLARIPFVLSQEYQDDVNKYIYRHPGLLIWRSYRGLLYVDGIQLDHSLEPLGWQHNRNVQIDFRLDLDAGTLEVIRNGQSLGIAFRDISGPVQPLVAFYASYEKKVELVRYETSQDDALVTAKLPPHAEPNLPKQEVQSIVSTSKFDSTSKYGDIGISSDGTTIFRSRSQSGNAYCPLTSHCTSGKYHFSFVIEMDQGASTCLGVGKAEIHLKTPGNIYKSEDMYLYRSFQGMLYSEGKELSRRFEEFWPSGTLVEMIVDIKENEGVVQYVVNGHDQGFAFTGLRPPLVPLVGFYSGMEKRVTLLHFEHRLGPQRSTLAMKYPDMNKLTEAGPRPPYNAPLPVLGKSLHATVYSVRCLHVCANSSCDKTVMVLPCKHAVLCPTHARLGDRCPQCNNPIEGVWNILC